MLYTKFDHNWQTILLWKCERTIRMKDIWPVHTNTSFEPFIKAEMIIKVKVQVFIVTFSPTLRLIFAIHCLSYVSYLLFIMNSKNIQQCYPKILQTARLLIFSEYFQKYEPFVYKIYWTAYMAEPCCPAWDWMFGEIRQK